MRHPRLFITAACVVSLLSRDAHADIFHIKSPSELKTEKGSELKLPPGYFLDEETWQERDLEMKHLQEQETRLVAENKSLRESASYPPWMYVLVGAIGIGVGATIVILK